MGPRSYWQTYLGAADVSQANTEPPLHAARQVAGLAIRDAHEARLRQHSLHVTGHGFRVWTMRGCEEERMTVEVFDHIL